MVGRASCPSPAQCHVRLRPVRLVTGAKKNFSRMARAGRGGCVLYAAEAQVVGPGRNFAFSTSSDDVARAVLVGAEEGPTPVGLLALGRLVGVPGVSGALGVAGHAPGGGQLLVVVGAVPVAGPLPDVSRHVIEAVAVGRILGHGGDACVAVRAGVVVGEVALVGVGHPLPVGPELVAPDEGLASQAAAGGELPLSFRGKALATPLGVGYSIFVGDLHDGIVVFPHDAAARSGGMTPVGAMHVGPPLVMVSQGYGVIGRGEYDGASHQVLRRRRRIILLPGLAFGYGDVSGGLYEPGELGVGDVGLVQVEAVHVHAMDGTGVFG